MPRLSNRAEIRQRIEAMCADRARGLPFAEIGKVHGVGTSFAHWAARHIQVVHVWRKWHRARWCKPDTTVQPVLRQVHEIRGRSQW